MAETSQLIAAKKAVSLKASPSNYGINHISWERPNDIFSWTSLRLMMKLGGYPTSETDGTNIFECSSNSLFLVPSAVNNAGGFNYSGTNSGGGKVVVGSAAGTGPVLSYSNQSGSGGTIILGTLPTTGGVFAFSPDRTPTSNRWFRATSSPARLSDGYTSASFRVSTSSNSPYTVTVSVSYAGIGYSVGDVLTIPASDMPDNLPLVLTLTSITPADVPISQDYIDVPVTGGTGSGALFKVTRSGFAGKPCAVTAITLTNGGVGYTLNNTLTIAAANIGGGTATNITVKAASIATTLPSTVTAIYKNVSQSSVTNGGSGAVFDIYRTGISGTPLAVSNIVQKFAGYGYSTSPASVITIANTSIGSSGTDLTITNGASAATVSGVIQSFSYGSNITSLSGWSGATVVSGGTIASEASKTYTNVPIYSVTGSGMGARATVTRNSSGVVNSVTLTSRGYGYQVNDLLVISASDIGGYGTKPEQLGVTADYHVYDNGVAPASPTASPVITNPGVNVVGTFHQGKEVYYALYAKYTSNSAAPSATPTSTWIKLGEASSISVKSTGMKDWLKSHLPAMYFHSYDNTADTVFYGGEGSNPDDSDLRDFLSLLAFHLDMYKTYATHVFNMTDPHVTDEKLLKRFLSEFGVSYSEIQDVAKARTVMRNILGAISKKGSIAGIKQLISLYTGSTATISLGNNILHGFNTSSFEQSLGQWRPVTAASPTSTTPLGYLNTAPYTPNLTLASPNEIAPVSTGSNAITGAAKVTNNSTNTAYIISHNVGPKITNVVTTVATGATQVVLRPNIAEVGDYAISYTTATTSPYVTQYIVPGTKVTAVDATTGTVTLSQATIGTLSANSEVWFSSTATDKVGAASAYQFVDPGAPYTFSMYANRPSGTTTQVPFVVGIRWRTTDGTLISSTSATASAASFATAGTWVRTSVSGLAPVSSNVSDKIVYAEPYFEVGTSAAPLNAGKSYYVDAAALNPGVLVTLRAKSGTTATLTTATAHNFTNGNTVVVKGVDTGATAIFDGTFTITATTPTTFSYTTSSGSVSSTAAAGLASSLQPYEDGRKVTMTTTGLDTTTLSRMKSTLGNAITLGQGTVGTPSTTVAMTSATAAVVSKQRRKGWKILAVAASSTNRTLYLDGYHNIKVGDLITVGQDADILDAATAGLAGPVTTSEFTTSSTSVTAVGTAANTITYAVGLPYTVIKTDLTAGVVSKVYDATWEILFTTDSAHGAIVGNQVSIANFSTTLINQANLAIAAVPTFNQFVVSIPVSATSPAFTAGTYSGSPSGSATIDFGRAGFNVLA